MRVPNLQRLRHLICKWPYLLVKTYASDNGTYTYGGSPTLQDRSRPTCWQGQMIYWVLKSSVFAVLEILAVEDGEIGVGGRIDLIKEKRAGSDRPGPGLLWGD